MKLTEKRLRLPVIFGCIILRSYASIQLMYSEFSNSLFTELEEFAMAYLDDILVFSIKKKNPSSDLPTPTKCLTV